jgi:outer membrane protein
MKNTIAQFIFLAVGACVLLQGSGSSYAEEADNKFSLACSALNPNAINDKVPTPNVLAAKYGFSVAKDIQSYVGSGLAYTLPQETMPNDTTSKIKIGVAGQVGIKFKLSGNSSLNVDYKYLYIQPDELHGCSNATPQSLGIGLDIKF